MSSSIIESGIGKKELEHLAELSRITLTPKEEEKFRADLGAILIHFEELQALSTDDIPPMTGGTDLTNALREDGMDDGGSESTHRGVGVESFPASHDGFLTVPPIFE